MRYFQLGLTQADRNGIGDPLTNSLMRSFLIEVIGIFPDNSRQMPVIEE